MLFYNALRHGMSYVDPDAAYCEDRYKQRVLNNLQRRAKSLDSSWTMRSEIPPERVFLRNTLHAAEQTSLRLSGATANWPPDDKRN